MNAAETWVDIYNRNSEKNVLSSIVNMVSGSDKEPLAAHFMSESGIVDTFILLGETPLNTMKQYTDLTGTAPLPPHASLAYHQCRWNYNDERDVTTVSENFDVHDIPMDTVSVHTSLLVMPISDKCLLLLFTNFFYRFCFEFLLQMWLDIEYTDDKK